MNAPSELGALLADMAAVLGTQALRTDEATRCLYSQDVYRAGYLAAAVVSPDSTQQVAQLVRLAGEAGVDLFVRGGGMSYTDAYLPTSERSVVLDITRMNRIRDINVTDLHATVEAGCTWAALDDALAKHGVRAVFWGPMSGRRATIGGGMSQGAATFGSGLHGTSAAAALGFEVVLGDGRVLQTAQFFRHSGPDLTGLFTGDAGAFGIKTAITLQLEPRPAFGEGLSFAFDSFDKLVGGLQAVARLNIATETFGAETALLRSIAGSMNFRQDAKTALAVIKNSRNPLLGAWRVLRMAQHGRRFLRSSHYTVSFLTEARDRTRLALNLRDIRAAAARFGREIPNTMATVTRATPFPDPLVLGPGGKRLLPLHGIFSYSKVAAFHVAHSQLIDHARQELTQLGIEVFVVYACIGSNALLYEPVIYWQDAWPELHKTVMPEAVLRRFRQPPDNLAARARVERLRLEIIELMRAHGAAHLQLGRAYPYLQNRDPAFSDLVYATKAALDPAHRINPGALGLLRP